MTRKAYWPRLIINLAVVVAFNWATIGRLSAVSFNLMLAGMYGVLAWLVGQRFHDIGHSSKRGYLPVLACGLGAALLGYVADHSLFEVEHPMMMAVLFHLFVFGPLIFAGVAAAVRSR